MKALMTLNGVAQLDAHQERLRQAAVVVCDLSMDTALIRSKIGEGPRLLAYANAGKLFMGGIVNPVWSAWRRRLLSIVYPQSIRDPGDATPHNVIEPTFANAEAYAEALAERVRQGAFAGAYIDDCWLHKPVRILEVEARAAGVGADVIQLRWEAYLRVYFGRLFDLGIGSWANCAADFDPGFYPTPCAEVNARHSAAELIPCLLDRSDIHPVLGEAPPEIPDQPILWYGGLSVDGLILEGELL